MMLISHSPFVVAAVSAVVGECAAVVAVPGGGGAFVFANVLFVLLASAVAGFGVDRVPAAAAVHDCYAPCGLGLFGHVVAWKSGCTPNGSLQVQTVDTLSCH